MQAQYQLLVYTEHRLCCLASNTSAKKFSHTQSILNISTVKHVSTPVDNLIWVDIKVFLKLLEMA